MAELIETRNRPALSGRPMIIAWLAMMIFACHASTHMVAAGDTWVALACGRHFINHGVDTVEPFSANSHKPGPTPQEVETWPRWAQWLTDKVGIETVKYWHPTGWINQNWLTHIIFYWLTTLSPIADADNLSFNSLVYWKFAVYVLAVICVYYTTRMLGVNPALAAVFSCFAMFVGRSFLDVRPAGFSNLLVAVFLLILVLAAYRNILCIWLIVPLTVFWCNVHGGYIYIFIMIAPFTALNLLTIASKKRFVSIGLKGIYHTIAAGLVAFLAMVVFNPFHLTNLTHTFVISVSKHAERWRSVHEWYPAFDWDNPVGTAVPFLVMYIIALVLLLIWVVILIVTSSFISSHSTKKRKPDASGEYQWPRIDLALVVVAALTIYMAIRSRRFIPIAAVAACPVMAMFIDQIVRAVSATYNFRRHGRLTVLPMPQTLQSSFILAGAVAVLGFGIWWGLKFKCVYLDPWPTDTKLNSVFMRMTASSLKPFDACKFIRDNKLKGKMFNYWTEGGFIAWGQQPDPNTGKTPLQLFMDGRAQAAYDHKVFDTYTEIMLGGPTVESASIRRHRLTAADYTEIGRWVDKELEQRDVWVVLMPLPQSNTPFVRGIEFNPAWCLVFLDNKQKLFVNVTTPQGRELFDGIISGRTIYPDDFSKNLILAHNMLLYGKDEAARKQGLDFAIKAFKSNPSEVPMLEIVNFAASFSYLEPQIYDFCRAYFDDFTKNKARYLTQDGYFNRITAAMNAAIYLKKIAGGQKNMALAESYAAKIREYDNERKRLYGSKVW